MCKYSICLSINIELSFEVFTVQSNISIKYFHRDMLTSKYISVDGLMRTLYVYCLRLSNDRETVNSIKVVGCDILGT